jgi:hypothetical protein
MFRRGFSGPGDGTFSFPMAKFPRKQGRFSLLEARAFTPWLGKTNPMEHNIDLAGLPLYSYDVACGRAPIVAILELIGNRIDRNATDL